MASLANSTFPVVPGGIRPLSLPGTGWHPGYWTLPPHHMEPLPLGVTFNGNPDKLAIFLDNVLGHLDHYALAYPTQRAMVNAVTAKLKG